jgi:hypothetical protein
MTMHHIQSQTMANSTTQFVTFSSIPQTYTHLQLRFSARATTAAAVEYIAFLASGTSTYSSHTLYGNGTTTTSTNGTAAFGASMGLIPAATALTNNFGSCIIDIYDYTSTSKLKVFRSISGYDNNGSGTVYLASGMDATSGTSLNALSSFSIFNGGNFLVGSNFDLYGITSSPTTGA